MPLRDDLCFVQFIHPGGEHQPDGTGYMNWNVGAHKRKFVEIAGRCRRQEAEFEGSLHFWAEWEPQSCALPVSQPLPHGPSFIHKPFYVTPHSYDKLENTDPFVFGDFFYTGCQQNKSSGPTQLRFLKRGSVILFGSCVDEHFVLDTVFVVDKWEDHDAQDFLRLKNCVPDIFWDVTLRAWYRDIDQASCGDEASCGKSVRNSCRLYWGATFDKPVDGMFSFFPCMPADQSPQGFARPVIVIPDIITNELRQGKRLNREPSREKVADYWRFTRNQIESKGLWLGVRAGTPERRSDPI